MKKGDLIIYTDDINDRLGTIGLIVESHTAHKDGEVEPPMMTVLWESGELEDVYADELGLVADSVSVVLPTHQGARNAATCA